MSGEHEGVAEHRSERYRHRIQAAGTVIKSARQRAGWSQAELARHAGLNKSDVSRLENGKHLEISVGRFFDICDALALDPVFVWTGHVRGRGRQSPGRQDDDPMDGEPGARETSRHKR